MISIAGIVDFFRRRLKRPLMAESLFRVDFDETGITVTHPRGESRMVQWSRLTKVTIRTTDEGPWSMDLFWGFHENGSDTPAAVFPGGATGEEQLITALYERLPGLSSEQIVNAMSSTSNACFVIWAI